LGILEGKKGEKTLHHFIPKSKSPYYSLPVVPSFSFETEIGFDFRCFSQDAEAG